MMIYSYRLYSDYRLYIIHIIYITFFSNDIGLHSINLNNLNLDDDNFDECHPKTINHIRLMARYNRYKQH